jgi:hypothetical protein
METINLKPYLPNEFNIDNIIYSKVHHDSDTKKTIFLYDKDPKKKIYIQSPELKHIINLVNNNNYYELNLPLYGKKQSSINSFIKFIKELDTKIISDAKNNKNEWFDESNKNIRYRSLIKNIHDDYIDTVEFKSGMFENGIIKLKLTNNTNITSNSKKILPDQLKLDQDIRTIFQIYAIWISGDLFGLYLKPIIIDQKYKIIEHIEFIASDSENDTVYNTDIDNLTENNISDNNISDNNISDNNISESNHLNKSNHSNISESNHSNKSESNHSNKSESNKSNYSNKSESNKSNTSNKSNKSNTLSDSELSGSNLSNSDLFEPELLNSINIIKL